MEEKKQHDCNCCKHHTTSKSGIKSFFVYVLFVVPIVSAFLFGSVTIDGSLAGKRGMNQSVQSRSLERNEKRGNRLSLMGEKYQLIQKKHQI